MNQPLPRPASVAVGVEVSEIRAAARPVRRLPTLVEFDPGHRYVLKSGPNEFSLPPGRYRVQLWSQYALWRVGRASIDIDTTNGPVRFHYAVPRTIYHRGAAGFAPQERPGKTADTVVRVVSVVCGALAVVAVLLAVILTLLQ